MPHSRCNPHTEFHRSRLRIRHLRPPTLRNRGTAKGKCNRAVSQSGEKPRRSQPIHWRYVSRRERPAPATRQPEARPLVESDARHRGLGHPGRCSPGLPARQPILPPARALNPEADPGEFRSGPRDRSSPVPPAEWEFRRPPDTSCRIRCIAARGSLASLAPRGRPGRPPPRAIEKRLQLDPPFPQSTFARPRIHYDRKVGR